MAESWDLLALSLVSTPDEVRKVSEMLRAAENPAPLFWERGVCEEIFVHSQGAGIRVLHSAGRISGVKRPIVLVPGFGATPPGFQEFYSAVRDRAELFYIETREKPSSRILDPWTDMSVRQSAHDVQKALAHLGLERGRDFVLMAPCWGASIVLEGLIKRVLNPPTVVVADPMHTLWFPKWVLRFVSPLLPVAFARSLRPLLAQVMIGNMK
jgi:hypothetical protein